MKTKHLFSTVKQLFSMVGSFAILFLLTGCIFDSLKTPEDTTGNGDTIVVEVTVRMPEDTPQTRISLDRDGLDVDLTWEAGDQIDLLIVYGTEQKKETVPVTIDGNDNKKATFSLPLPQGTYDSFDLYGVYGGGGLSTVAGEEHLVVLPTIEKLTPATLAGLHANKAFVLTFTCTNINKGSPVSAHFEHLGSLFNISLANTGTTDITGIEKAELIASGGIAAHVNEGNATYNIKTKDITGTNPSPAVLSFNLGASTNLAAGNTLDFWGWYIPGSGHWPAVDLKLYHSGGTTETDFIKVARSSSTETGKAYHLAATFHEGVLHFATNKFTDPRDGGVVYNTVTIGGQVWMAENLKYLPSVVGPETESYTDPYYYVYGYNGTDVGVAKTEGNYQTYGVLYNWTAAMAGAASSNLNPSGVQGICPDGWHLPSVAEWNQLQSYLVANGYNYDGSTTGNKTGKALASESGWNTSKVEGAIGNTDYPAYRNKSGFSALPGGERRGSGNYFSSIGNYGFWWSSTETIDPLFVSSVILNFNSVTGIGMSGRIKEGGLSVRCVKN